MTAVTFDQVVEQFAEIVAEQPPGYTYPRQSRSGPALYVHGDVPGCIVGRWLHTRHGVPLEVFAGLEGTAGAGVVMHLLADEVLPRDFLDHPSSALTLKFLQAIQIFQDEPYTWQHALDRAHKLVTSAPWSVLLAPNLKVAVDA